MYFVFHPQNKIFKLQLKKLREDTKIKHLLYIFIIYFCTGSRGEGSDSGNLTFSKTVITSEGISINTAYSFSKVLLIATGF